MLGMPRIPALRCFLFSLLSGAACGAEDDRTVDIGGNECASIEPCSITEEACQQAILELTACVRGDDARELPPIRTLSRAQLAAELSAQAEESAGSEMDEGTRAMELTFAELQLIAPATSLRDASVAEQAASVAAYYRREEKDITIISDAVMEQEPAMNVLSHELTHYLQDRVGQLRNASEATLDESVSLRALTEGDAVVTSYRTIAAMRGWSASQVRWDALWSELERSIVASTEASDSPLLAAATQLPYVISPPAIELAWERGGRAQVEQFYESPPLTQLDWLEGSTVFTYAEPLDCFPALPPDGYELIAADSLGIAGVFALLSARELNSASLALAGRWRQDQLAVYVQRAQADEGTLEVLAAWRIRFADSASASDLEHQLEILDLDVTRAGSELLIRVRSGADANLEASGCPTDEQFAAVPRRGRDVEASLRTVLQRLQPARHH